jgi:hypothetical protein
VSQPVAGVELDHIIFFCGAGAPEADALLGRGLHEGPGNSHPGQGTVNRRFFCRNVYLELLWVEDYEEAQAGEARRTGLWDRWINRHNGGCPIGLVFRPSVPGTPTPFPSWSYIPKYFPAGFSIEVAIDIPPTEPLLFYLPFAKPALVEALLANPPLMVDDCASSPFTDDQNCYPSLFGGYGTCLERQCRPRCLEDGDCQFGEVGNGVVGRCARMRSSLLGLCLPGAPRAG